MTTTTLLAIFAVTLLIASIGVIYFHLQFQELTTHCHDIESATDSLRTSLSTANTNFNTFVVQTKTHLDYVDTLRAAEADRLRDDHIRELIHATVYENEGADGDQDAEPEPDGLVGKILSNIPKIIDTAGKLGAFKGEA